MPGTMMMVWRVTTMTLLLLRYRSCLAWTTTWKYSGLSRHGQCRSTTNLRRKLSSLPSLSSSLAMVRRGEAPPSHLRKQNEHPPRNYRLISSEVVSKEGLRSTKSECGDDRWEQEALEECFVDCWNATYWTVNQYKDPAIDTILQRLCSPAPQGFYIIQRAVQHEMAARRAANRKGGSLGSVLGSLVYLLKQGHVFAIRNDESGSWTVLDGQDANNNGTTHFPEDDNNLSWKVVQPNSDDCRSTLELAHEALELASLPTRRNDQIQAIANKAKTRLGRTLGTDVRGRTCGDAAFAFALAGINDDELLGTLTRVAYHELKRIGLRPSFHSKYVLQLVEKLAAAGLRGVEINRVYRCAADCLDYKKEHHQIVETLRHPDGRFDLLSTRPLMWLWRYASKQTKLKPNGMMKNKEEHAPEVEELGLQNSASQHAMYETYRTADEPLVIDIGCGMGVSLIGLASLDDDALATYRSSVEGTVMGAQRWALPETQLLGCDLSPMATSFAQSVASRWDLTDRLRLLCESAETVLESIVEACPHRVQLISIQFPTPYKLLSDTDGNAQLPTGTEDGFMVSSKLLAVVRSILVRSGGFLMLQSNCEDVAITMLSMARDAGFEAIPMPYPVTTLPDLEKNSRNKTGRKGPDDLRIPQRTKEWIRLGGNRAIGVEWSQGPLLPPRAVTETEVACELQGVPVHRCLVRCV